MTTLTTFNKTEPALKDLEEVAARIEGRWTGPENSKLTSTINEFSRVLKSREAAFLTIHFRNPFIDEGRYTRIILGDEGRERTIYCLREILGSVRETNISPEEANKFHDHLLDIYFGLIGRADSFSDTALRVTGRSSGKGITDQTFTFSFDGTGAPHIKYVSLPDTQEVRIVVTKNLQYRLLGWDGDRIQDAVPKECKLLHPLYKVVWASLSNPQAKGETSTQFGNRILRSCREELETACFFASREALVSGESARLIRDEESKRNALLVFNRLFASEPLQAEQLFENDGEHKQQLIQIEQVLAMIQAVAIYAPVSSNTFSLLAHVVKKEYPFASGLTVGGISEAWSDLQLRSSSLVRNMQIAFDVSKGDKQTNNLLEGKFGWLQGQWWTELQSTLISKGLSKEAFECLVYFTDGLLGKNHEGERLSFRIAVATDEGLRECFTPLFGETGLAGQKSDEPFFRIDIPEDVPNEEPEKLKDRWTKVINRLDSLIALVEGNYSFLQDSSIYLCLAYVKHGLEVRYLAQLHPRLKRASADVLFQSISQIDNVISLSKTASPAILALLHKDHTGHLAFGGELIATGTKGKPNQWGKYGEEDWFKAKLEPEIKATPNSWKYWEQLRDRELPFYNHLCKVVELISAAPGKGATFVLGEWGSGSANKGLRKMCVAMTPVFEMVKDWRIEKIDKDTLYQAAIQDGAIVIAMDPNQQRLYCRRQLSSFDTKRGKGPFDPDQWSPNGSNEKLIKLWDTANSRYYWEDWGKWFKWGTRHKTAAGLAYIGRGDYSVVCISSDGDVHLFDGFKVYNLSKVKKEALPATANSAVTKTA
jgi:hypothetical protein